MYHIIITFIKSMHKTSNTESGDDGDDEEQTVTTTSSYPSYRRIDSQDQANSNN